MLRSLRIKLKSLAYLMAAYVHDTVAVWRIHRGGLYFLRDRPDWYVNQWAATPLANDRFWDAIVMEAVGERYRRIDMELRDLIVKVPARAQQIQATRDDLAKQAQERLR
jgi:hypothetical protein